MAFSEAIVSKQRWTLRRNLSEKVKSNIHTKPGKRSWLLKASENQLTESPKLEKTMRRGSHHEEWDEQQSSNTLPRDDEPRHRQQRDGSGIRQITSGQVLVFINFILQLLSAIIGLLNSNPRPLYSLILVSLSFASFVLWIIELVKRGKRETLSWKWRGKLIPLLYSSSTNKSFFRGVDIVGLPSALFTFIITVVNFDQLVQHANTQIQITLWPIIAASFLLCSKFWADRTNKDAPNLVPLDSVIIVNAGSEYQKSPTILLDVNAYIRCVWCLQVCKIQLCSQITIERVFAIVNFILEILSALLDQLSSEPKPQYALILMLLSLCSSILCIFGLWYKAKTEGVTWSWKWISGKVLWLYPNRPFFSFWDKVGLVSAMFQLILTTVNYGLVVQHIGQVPICMFPIVFGLIRSFPNISDSPNKTEGEGNVDEEDGVALVNQRQTVCEVISDSPNKTEGEGNVDQEDGVAHVNQKQTVCEVMSPKTESEEEKVALIEEKVALSRNQIWRVNEVEFPEAEGNFVQSGKTTHPNLRRRARKVSVPKEIEEPSGVNVAKRSLDELKVVKKSLNELYEGACRLMKRTEVVLVLEKYMPTEIIKRIECLKTDCLILGQVLEQLKLANWVEKALAWNTIEFAEETHLELKKYSVTEICEKISGLKINHSDVKEIRMDLDVVNWVVKDLDDTQNKIELEEKTFLKIKREKNNMLEVEWTKPSLAKESPSELNKKTDFVALATSLDEIKKTEQSLAKVKKEVGEFKEKITSLKKALDLPQICPGRHLSPIDWQIIVESLIPKLLRLLYGKEKGNG